MCLCFIAQVHDLGLQGVVLGANELHFGFKLLDLHCLTVHLR